jgi:uncharacterized protein (DUF169 family)
MDFKSAAARIQEALRLRTEPLGIAFLKDQAELPKCRRPSQVFGKRVTICQGVTMARVYGWSVGLTREDLVCVPGMLVFGFTPATDPILELAQLFCEVGFNHEMGPALKEVEALPRFAAEEIAALYLAPLDRLALNPDVVAVWGNPAQIMRLVQAANFSIGERVTGDFSGKVECASYLIGPYRTNKVTVAIPGMGDRIFSMTQDDELVISFPAALLGAMLNGLQEAGRRIGVRYPITVYQNFTPSFPPMYEERAKKWGIIE